MNKSEYSTSETKSVTSIISYSNSEELQYKIMVLFFIFTVSCTAFFDYRKITSLFTFVIRFRCQFIVRYIFASFECIEVKVSISWLYETK